jgi:hypothetical protein
VSHNITSQKALIFASVLLPVYVYTSVMCPEAQPHMYAIRGKNIQVRVG